MLKCLKVATLALGIALSQSEPWTKPDMNPALESYKESVLMLLTRVAQNPSQDWDIDKYRQKMTNENYWC